MTLSSNTAALSPAQKRAYGALEEKRYFKLICGGSFTDASKVEALTAVYARAGVDCIDMAPEPSLIASVESVYASLPPELLKPLVMVSIPLDPDPHFRKIDLLDPACIVCNACIPVCPTDAIAEGTSGLVKLEIDQPLCYGCGRCVAVCPTDALVLHPIYADASFQEVLSHPLVEAVEIHSRHMDPYMLKDFLARFRGLLYGKVISVCFRPDQIDTAQWLAFLQQLQAQTAWPLILQADGQPMSGSEAPDASLPALAAARLLFETTGSEFPLITLSGGINEDTARYLQEPAHRFISGVGMGTVARRKVWPFLDAPESLLACGLPIARDMVSRFKVKK